MPRLGIAAAAPLAVAALAVAARGAPAITGTTPGAMPVCGRSGLDAAIGFLGMWLAMMAPMMLPVLVPMLARYRRAVGPTTAMRLAGLTALVGIGYAAIWLVVGVAAVALDPAAALARATPHAAAAAFLVAGALQLTAWKARQLARCTQAPDRALAADARSAWRHGLRLGRRCAASCAGPTALLLVLGMMDPRAMALVTAAITAERLAPGGATVARLIGAGFIAAGLLAIARAGLG